MDTSWAYHRRGVHAAYAALSNNEKTDLGTAPFQRFSKISWCRNSESNTMSTASSAPAVAPLPILRPTPEEIQNHRVQRRSAQQELRQEKKAQGLEPLRSPSLPTRTSDYTSAEEEYEARQTAVLEQFKVLQSQLPTLLKRFAKIPDPRNPRKIKHQLTVLLIYGILHFVYQMASRREANRVLTGPVFVENLQLLFPDLHAMPHQGTLHRLLSNMDPSQIENAHLDLIRRLIKKKKFRRYLIQKCYPIAIDGTGKHSRYELLSQQWQQREIEKGKETQRTQFYVYVLEANLVFHNGMVLPLMSEFLDFTEGDTGNNKQDCEQRAFHRLAERIHKEFKKLPILLLLDGLYPNGPTLEVCKKYGWQFMIVLQDKSLPSVWEEFEGLQKLEVDHIFIQHWGDRRQTFRWSNDIEYDYEKKGKKTILVHVVVCAETWEEIDNNGQRITKNSRHAWLSSQRLSPKNLHERCNLGARHRWGIEAGNLIEKHHGYQYEHCFSHNWNAMRGYHYLMRLGHMLNVLASFSTQLVQEVRKHGVRGFLRWLRSTLEASRIDSLVTRSKLASCKRPQLHLV
jgi:hypothetical protein